MKSNSIFWLRLSYWVGAIIDLIAGLMMVFPSLFAIDNQLDSFAPGLDYRYAMGMGAPLMFAWTILLLWADRKPYERKGILPITVLIILGEVVNGIVGVQSGFIPVGGMISTWVIQALLSILFIYSYLNARKMRTA
jgi:hypothetical protein